MRSLCSEGDLGGLLPGEPREDGGLVEGFGEGSGPVGTSMQEKRVLQMENKPMCKISSETGKEKKMKINLKTYLLLILVLPKKEKRQKHRLVNLNFKHWTGVNITYMCVYPGSQRVDTTT